MLALESPQMDLNFGVIFSSSKMWEPGRMEKQWVPEECRASGFCTSLCVWHGQWCAQKSGHLPGWSSVFPWEEEGVDCGPAAGRVCHTSVGFGTTDLRELGKPPGHAVHLWTHQMMDSIIHHLSQACCGLGATLDSWLQERTGETPTLVMPTF